MSEQQKNTIVVLEPVTKPAEELLKLVEEKSQATLIRAKTPEEAIQHIVVSLPCVLVCCIPDNKDVPTRVQLFKRLENTIKHHGLKVYVTTPIKNRQLQDLATQKMGVSDYIVEPVPVRTMQFKINLQLKAVDTFRRQKELAKAAQEQIVIKKLDAKGAPAAAGAEVKTNNKAALATSDDTFLFKNNGVKKAGKKFTVELEGPDPSTGEWVQHEDKGDAQSSWRWVPNDEKEAQAKGEKPKDGWVHEGEKPVFNETSQKWAMTSEKPSLALLDKGEVKAQKLGLDEKGEIFVAEDSPAAEENLRKNREQAAAEKAKKGALTNLLGENAPNPDAGVLQDLTGKGPKPASEGPNRHDLKKDKPKTDLNSLLGGDDDDGPGAGDLQDLRAPDGKKPTGEVQDLRAPEPEKADASAAPAAAPKIKPMPGENPADFLKRKKEAAAKAGALDKNVNEVKADPLGEGAVDLRRKSEGPARDGGLNQPARKGGKGADLSSLADRLGDLGADDENDGVAGDVQDLRGPKQPQAGSDRPEAQTLKNDKKPTGDLADLRSKLGEDPTAVNDRQSEGAGARLLGLREEKKRTLDDIKAMLESPLPDQLDPEEEEELREELGLKGRPEIKPKELARKKRMLQVKELKDRLGELNSEIDEEEKRGPLELSAADRKTDERQLNEHDLSKDKLEGIRRALDGDDAIAEAEEDIKKRLKDKEEERKKGKALTDKAKYMPEADLQPLGNAWEAAGDGHYVYIDASVRYKGFQKLEDLLPFWVFEGEDVPVLLSKSKEWRFLGGLPTHAKVLADIPPPVRDFLISLRDQLLSEDQKAALADSDAAEKAEVERGADERAEEKKKKFDLDDGEDLNARDDDRDEDEEAAEAKAEGRSRDREDADEASASDGEADSADDDEKSEDGQEELSAGRKRKRGDDDTRDATERLRDKLGLDDDEEEEAAEARDRDDADGDDEQEDEKRGGSRNDADEDERGGKSGGRDGKRRGGDDSDDLSASDHKNSRGDDDSAPEDEEEEERDDREETMEAKMERLRSALGDDSDDETEASGKKKRSDDGSASEEEATPAALAASKSEGVQKFLEKRRQKEAAEAAEEEARAARGDGESGGEAGEPVDRKNGETAADAPGAAAAAAAKKARDLPKGPGFLGLYVALSDAMANLGSPSLKIRRVLKAMEDSFRNCNAYCTMPEVTEGAVEIRYRSVEEGAAGERVILEDGASVAIRQGDGENGEILGYLYLGRTGSRRAFEEAEKKALERVASKLGPMLLAAASESVGESAEAA